MSTPSTDRDTNVRRLREQVLRPMDVFGSVHPPAGHAEMRFVDVRVPAENLILGEGRGFEIAQGRLGAGRIHHSMRQVGAAQRCLELMCQRAVSREAFGRKLSDHGMVRKDIAVSRCEIEQARYLTLAAAAEMDRVGNKAARDLISMITIIGPQMAQDVADRAIQVHGGIGASSDTPVAEIFPHARFLRIADGPDEVHLTQLARSTVAAYARVPLHSAARVRGRPRCQATRPAPVRGTRPSAPSSVLGRLRHHPDARHDPRNRRPRR